MVGAWFGQPNLPRHGIANQYRNTDSLRLRTRHQRGSDLPDGELRRRALQWALWHNGRTGRAARQFVDDLQEVLT